MWQILPKPVLAEVGPNGHAPSKPRDVSTFGNHPAIFFCNFLHFPSFFINSNLTLQAAKAIGILSGSFPDCWVPIPACRHSS